MGRRRGLIAASIPRSGIAAKRYRSCILVVSSKNAKATMKQPQRTAKGSPRRRQTRVPESAETADRSTKPPGQSEIEKGSIAFVPRHWYQRQSNHKSRDQDRAQQDRSTPARLEAGFQFEFESVGIRSQKRSH